jgi:hypothetical protein
MEKIGRMDFDEALVKLISSGKISFFDSNGHCCVNSISKPNRANNYSFSSHYWLCHEEKNGVQATWDPYDICCYNAVFFVSTDYGTSVYHYNCNRLCSKTYFVFYSNLIPCWSWECVIGCRDLDKRHVAPSDFDGKLHKKKTRNAVHYCNLDFGFNLGNHHVHADLCNQVLNLRNLDTPSKKFGIGENNLGNPFISALQSGLFKTIGTILPLLPFLAGYPVDLSILISVSITIVLLSVVGTLAAVVAQVDVKKKVTELITAGLILSALTFLLGKLTSILIGMIQVA